MDFRVTRGQDHRFVGEAVRVGKFQLTPDGQQIANGLKKRRAQRKTQE